MSPSNAYSSQVICSVTSVYLGKQIILAFRFKSLVFFKIFCKPENVIELGDNKSF